jgi:hypothetical protein
VRHRLAVDNMRDSVDHTITPVHRRVEHATSGIATDRERDGEPRIWYTLEGARTGRLRRGLPGESGDQSHKNDRGKAPPTLHDPPLLLHGHSTQRPRAFASPCLSLRLKQSTCVKIKITVASFRQKLKIKMCIVYRPHRKRHECGCCWSHKSEGCETGVGCIQEVIRTPARFSIRAKAKVSS